MSPHEVKLPAHQSSQYQFNGLTMWSPCKLGFQNSGGRNDGGKEERRKKIKCVFAGGGVGVGAGGCIVGRDLVE